MARGEYDTSREEYDTDIPPLETEEEAAENIANIYERRNDTRKKEKSGKGLNVSDLPILLSKIHTNNSSKEIINGIKQLVKTYTTINK